MVRFLSFRAKHEILKLCVTIKYPKSHPNSSKKKRGTFTNWAIHSFDKGEEEILFFCNSLINLYYAQCFQKEHRACHTDVTYNASKKSRVFVISSKARNFEQLKISRFARNDKNAIDAQIEFILVINHSPD